MRKFLKGYAFIIPEGIWSSQDEFDSDLGKLFSAKGMDTEIIIDASESTADRIFSLTPTPLEKVPQSPKSKPVKIGKET